MPCSLGIGEAGPTPNFNKLALSASKSMFGHALGVVERRGASDIMGRQMVKLGLIGGVGFGRRIGLFQIEHERHQGLGDEASAEHAEMARVVGAGAERIGVILQQGANS